jgi:hypothetical protein
MRRQSKQSSITKVSDLFAVYKTRLKAPQGSVIKEVVLAVEEVVGVKIDKKYFSYNVNNKTVFCNATSLVRSEIKLKQPEIARVLQRRLGEQNSPRFYL